MSIQYARLNVLRNCSLDESMPNIPLRAGLLAMYLRIQPFIFNHRLIYGTRRPFIGRSTQEALSIIAPPRLWLGVVCVKNPIGDNNTKETCCWFFFGRVCCRCSGKDTIEHCRKLLGHWVLRYSFACIARR